jgi:hypothetical protein
MFGMSDLRVETVETIVALFDIKFNSMAKTLKSLLADFLDWAYESTLPVCVKAYRIINRNVLILF